MMNVNGMACIYSTNKALSIINEEKGLVLKDDMNGPMNNSCGVHREENEFDGKEFRGIKVRFTNGLVNSGHVAPVSYKYQD